MHEEISSTNEDNGIADDTEDIVRRAIVTTFSTTADTLENDIDSGNNEGLQRSQGGTRIESATPPPPEFVPPEPVPGHRRGISIRGCRRDCVCSPVAAGVGRRA